MWDRFNVLCVVAFLAFCVALAAVQAAHASTPRDAERVLWYLRGQLQLATGERGWAILELGCRPRPSGQWVYCWTRVYIPSARKMFCQHALYRTTGATLTGQHESAPKPCTRAQRFERTPQQSNGPGA